MHVRTYNAKDMNEAMKLVRDGLGDDAIIISTTRGDGGKGVKVTAAIEPSDEDALYETLAIPRRPTTKPGLNGTLSDSPAQVRAEPPSPAPSPVREVLPEREEDDSPALVPLHQALVYHGVSARLAHDLLQHVNSEDAEDHAAQFAIALSRHFTFAPLRMKAGATPIMLVGPPGVGKTITCAKMATEAVLNGIPVTVITTDTDKAGGVEQLKAFTDILKLALYSASDAATLTRLLTTHAGNSLVIVDTAGVNPYETAELKSLGRYITSGEVEPVLVMGAGADAAEAGDIAGNFAYLGANHFIVTKIDAARRYGSILSAAHHGGLAFSYFSRTSGVADEMERIEPGILAALLLRYERTEL